MWKTNSAMGIRCFPAVVLILLMSASQSSAAISAVGDPILGNSWAQGWTENSVGTFDLIAAQIVSGGPLEAPVFRNFTIAPAGWTDQLTAPFPTGLSRQWGIATGPSTTTSIGFQTAFVGVPSTSLVMNLFAFRDSLLVDSVRASWNGHSPWIFSAVSSTLPSRDYIEALIVPAGAADVPEPSSIIGWSLLGLTISGAGWWQRRKVSA